MPIYALGDLVPDIHPGAYIHPDAVIIGEVIIGDQSSVWPCAVLRGDDAPITIGERTSVQDGCVFHVKDDLPTTVGDECVIGHQVHLEGCTIEDNALVGNGSVVMDDAVVESWALVGANAVVRPGMRIPSLAMALGVPAQIRENRVDKEEILHSMRTYLARCDRYRAGLRLL